MQGSPFGLVSLAVDEPEGDPQRGPGTINSPKTHLHISPYPGQHVRSHADTEANWRIHQQMISAYRDTDRAAGLRTMTALIDALSHRVPATLTEPITLGRTLKRRAADVLASFTWPGTSNSPTEAINGRHEHFHGSALGLRNLTNCTARWHLEAGSFRPQLRPRL